MPEKSGIDTAFWVVAGVPAAGAGVCPRTGVEAAVANATTRRSCRRCKFMLCSPACRQGRQGAPLVCDQLLRDRLDPATHVHLAGPTAIDDTRGVGRNTFRQDRKSTRLNSSHSQIS